MSLFINILILLYFRKMENNLYDKIKKFDTSILIIFHAIKLNDNPTSIYKETNITYAYVHKVLKKLCAEELIYKVKNKRVTNYNYTTKGYELFNLINSFITKLNNK
jgi:predicted transcriptional regulator